MVREDRVKKRGIENKQVKVTKNNGEERRKKLEGMGVVLKMKSTRRAREDNKTTEDRMLKRLVN